MQIVIISIFYTFLRKQQKQTLFKYVGKHGAENLCESLIFLERLSKVNQI